MASPPPAVDWNNDMIFRLIEEYRLRPALWDPSATDFKDKQKRNDEWRDMAVALGLPRDAVYRKMKILLTQYHRECKQKSEHGSKWFAFARLSFLRPRQDPARAPPTPTPALAPVPALLTSDADDSPVNVHFLQTYEVKHEFNDTASEDASCDNSLGAMSMSAPAPTPSSARKRRRSDERYGAMQPEPSANERDEYAVFGEYVAMKLRKVRSEYARVKAQQQIHSVLFNAEFGDS